MGTLLQSWPVTFKIIAPWRISNPWITTPERSSSFCHLSSTHGLLLFSLLCSPSNILTTWLITPLILPTATARKWGGQGRGWGEGGLIQTSRSIRVNVSFTACQSVSRLLAARALWSCLTIAHRRLKGGSDIYHPLQQSRPYLVIGQISLSPLFMAHCQLWPLSSMSNTADPHTATEDSPPEPDPWPVPEALVSFFPPLCC